MHIINRSTRAGLMALIVGCGAAATVPMAEATTAKAFTFVFSYDAQSLTTAEGRAELEKQLDHETAKHCRDDFGGRVSIATVRDCQRDLVKAVRFALVRGVEGDHRKCIAVALTPTAIHTDACDSI